MGTAIQHQLCYDTQLEIMKFSSIHQLTTLTALVLHLTREGNVCTYIGLNRLAFMYLTILFFKLCDCFTFYCIIIQLVPFMLMTGKTRFSNIISKSWLVKFHFMSPELSTSGCKIAIINWFPSYFWKSLIISPRSCLVSSDVKINLNLSCWWNN